jgi:hypothetical protein
VAAIEVEGLVRSYRSSVRVVRRRQKLVEAVRRIDFAVAVVRIRFSDTRRGSRELDVTDAEADDLGGRTTARRGRRPKVES